MNSYKKLAAVLTALCMTTGFTACGGDNNTDAPITEAVTTTGVTVEINTETLAPEQEEQVADLADSLTGELENKTIKWMSFYDPWHPTGYGNSKPVSVELFEKKYGGEIEYYTTTWANQFNDLSTYILGGEGIDFFPAPEAVPKCALDKMTQSYDQYIDWNNPLWQSVKSINDQFMLGDNHYLMVTQIKEGYVVYYNKQTIEANGFDDPAELYANGEWTLEKFKEMLMEYVDPEADQYGLDGWFNCTPLYLASGVPSISLEDGKVKNNLSDPVFERAMLYQSELYKNGLMLDLSMFNWTPQLQFMGEGKELFYIGGLYEIESDPEIWTRNFGEVEDVFFVPVPRDEKADKYYYNAEIDCYNLCAGAQNPEGVARFMECLIAATGDENAKKISDDKYRNDYGWTDEMIEMKYEVLRLTQENPVRDMYGGLNSDLSSVIGDSFNQPLKGGDWFSIRESVSGVIDTQLIDVNAQIEALG